MLRLPIVRALFALLLLALGAGAWIVVDSRRVPVPPAFDDLPAYDPTPEPPSGIIACFFSVPPLVSMRNGGDLERSVEWMEDFWLAEDDPGDAAPKLGRVTVTHRDWTPSTGWVYANEATMDDVPRPLAGVARTLDELYVLTREEGDPDWDEWLEAVPERGTKEFDVWLNSPEYELWVDPPSGAVRLERWTLSGGVGWPTVSEDASAVTPLGTASGRALLTPSFVGGVRLLPKLRSDLELTIEPLGRYAFDARSLAVDPDGRYLLIATRDRGLLRIDLAAPEAAPVCLLPPPGHGMDWVPIKSYEYESRPPRLGDSMHGERVLLLADEGGGHWVLIDRDNDGDFDDRKHLGGLQAKQLGFTRTTYVPDPGAGLTWS